MLRPALALAALGLLVSQSGQPTFKSGAEAIWVTATVLDKEGRLVTDLTSEDFEIRDHGRVREITAFRNDTVPFAVAIMFDISGSNLSNMGLMRRGASQFISRFEPGDRAIIGTFEGVTSISPRFSGNAKTLLRWVDATMGGAAVPCMGPWTGPARGGSAVWDAMQCGVQSVAGDAETPRRVVLVITDGVDNASSTTPQTVLDSAEQYGVMVYAIATPGSEGTNLGGLQAIAEGTGGGYFLLTGRDDLVDTFARVADELRHQYVFGFTRDASDTSKPDLKVRSLRPDTITRFRRVSLEFDPLTTGAVASDPSPPETSATAAAGPRVFRMDPVSTDAKARRSLLAGRLDRFERGDWSEVPTTALSVPELRAAFNDLRAAAPLWIAGAGEAAAARRRLGLATYVLQLLNAQDDRILWQDSQPAADLLEWACALVRAETPVAAEDLWYVATMGLLERFADQAVFERHIAHARERLPTLERWHLLLAIAAEQRTWPERRDERAFTVDSGLAKEIVARYEAAAAHEGLRAEAELRLGYFDLRRGHVDDALARFRKVGRPPDFCVRYWLRLLGGRALELANRPDEAIASYQLALSDVPYAQSAAVALGSALVKGNRGREAAALLSRTLGMQPAPVDPWIFYTFPDWRFWPIANVGLRKAIAP